MRWFRMYADAVDDAKLRLLAPSDRWYFVAIMCCKAEGMLDNGDPPSLTKRKLIVKLELTQSELDELQRRLMEVGLIDDEFHPKKWNKRQYIGTKGLPDGESLEGYKGYVYFIGGKDGPVKIGYSKNPWARLKDFQTGAPYPLSVLGVVKTAEISERRAHEVFEQERQTGEWFERSLVVRQAIKAVIQKKIRTQDDLFGYVEQLRSISVATTTDTDTDTDTEKENGADAPPDGLDAKAWKRFVEYRKQIRKPIKPASMLAAQRKLAGLGADQAACVEETIANGWTGVFALKSGGPAGKAEARPPVRQF